MKENCCLMARESATLIQTVAQTNDISLLKLFYNANKKIREFMSCHVMSCHVLSEIQRKPLHSKTTLVVANIPLINVNIFHLTAPPC